MLGAALLETETYEEAALTSSVWSQAALVVVISALATGVGFLGSGLTGFVVGFLAAVLGWCLGALSGFWVATRKFNVPPTQATWGASLRGLGFASTPRLFLVFTFLPAIGFLVGLAVHAWTLITIGFAVKPALDLDEARPAIMVALASWLPMLLVWALAAIVV